MAQTLYQQAQAGGPGSAPGAGGANASGGGDVKEGEVVDAE
jgi:hypothetical protein